MMCNQKTRLDLPVLIPFASSFKRLFKVVETLFWIAPASLDLGMPTPIVSYLLCMTSLVNSILVGKHSLGSYRKSEAKCRNE